MSKRLLSFDTDVFQPVYEETVGLFLSGNEGRGRNSAVPCISPVGIQISSPGAIFPSGLSKSTPDRRKRIVNLNLKRLIFLASRSQYICVLRAFVSYHPIMFKRPALLLLLCALCLGFLPACATSEMISRAEGRPGPMDPPNFQPPPPMPAYYALVPLVLPFDAVAWPVQFAMGYRP